MNFNPSTIVETPTPVDLQAENTRLQKLVADLLVKNQQLRAALQATQRANA